MNPEYVPQRLSDFLSCMLGQKVRVIRAIPTDSTRLADESVLLAMDIVVELEDGSIANVEMQRIGYLFPGQRSACYSADLLLRQYKRLRGSRRDAWLTLFSSDDPDRIVELLEDYPEFKEIYREGYQICRNMEKIMGIFSEELYMLDRNTERYMFDEMQKDLDEAQNNLDEAQNNLNRMNDKYDRSVRNGVELMRSLGMSDQEIVSRLCEQYQLTEIQAASFLETQRSALQ